MQKGKLSKLTAPFLERGLAKFLDDAAKELASRAAATSITEVPDTLPKLRAQFDASTGKCQQLVDEDKTTTARANAEISKAREIAGRDAAAARAELSKLAPRIAQLKSKLLAEFAAAAAKEAARGKEPPLN